MAELIGGIVAIVGTWFVLGVSLVGLGSATQRLLVRPASGRAASWDVVWLGFAVLLLLLQLWHLVWRIDVRCATVVVGAGWLAAIAHRRALVDAWRMHLPGVGTVGVATGIVVWIALRGMGEMTLFDSGMYHVPFVQWAKAYPIVPGLGNLHGRLAFNPASLLFAALTDIGPWADGSQHVANGFLVALFVVPCVLRLARWQRSEPLRPRTAFELATAPAILTTALRQDVRSLSTDLPVFVLLAAVGGMLFDLLTRSVDDNERPVLRATIMAVLAATITVKLSAAPFALSAMVLVLAIDGPRQTEPIRDLALPVALVLVWMVRGTILSGYPMYPSRVIALPVDWRLSLEQASAEAAWISMSARNLNTNVLLGSHEWVGRWLSQVLTRGDLFHHLLAPSLVAVASVLGILRRWWKHTLDWSWRRGTLLVVPVTIALLVWWWTAPHTRMAQGPVWILAGATTAFAIGPCVATVAIRRAILLAPVALFALLAGRIALGEAWRAPAAERTATLIGAVLALPTPAGWIAPTPEPDLLDDVLPSGLHLAVPRVDNSCWNGPLLCTPHPTARLTLRDSSNVGAGFRMNGAWQPEWFPNPWIPFLAYWRCLQRGPETPDREATCLRGARGQATRSGAPLPNGAS